MGHERQADSTHSPLVTFLSAPDPSRRQAGELEGIPSPLVPLTCFLQPEGGSPFPRAARRHAHAVSARLGVDATAQTWQPARSILFHPARVDQPPSRAAQGPSPKPVLTPTFHGRILLENLPSIQLGSGSVPLKQFTPEPVETLMSFL